MKKLVRLVDGETVELGKDEQLNVKKEYEKGHSKSS